MVSLPAPPSITSESMLASAPLIVTCAGSPVDEESDGPLLTTLMVSLPTVPLTVTLFGPRPSPTPLAGYPSEGRY